MSSLDLARLDDLVPLAYLAVEGRHRARFLHAMTTAEVQKLGPGAATFALVATAQGRHVGQLRLEVEEQRLVLGCDAAARGPIVDTLKKHKIADDVRFGEPLPDLATLAVVGPDEAAFAALVDHVGPPPAPGRFAERGPLRVTLWEARDSELGQPTLRVRGPRAAIDALAEALAGITRPLSREAWEARRVAAGWPRDGVDLGPDDSALASERLFATVSWTKGCFLGQEVFVMARDRGEAPKRLCRVALEQAGAWPAAGAALSDGDGKVVGVLGSAGGEGALAVLKRKAAAPGHTLLLEDGRGLRVLG